MEDEDFIDPFQLEPEETPPATNGGFTQSTFEITLSLTPYGLPYSTVRVGGIYTHATPVVAREHARTVRDMSDATVAQVAEQLASRIADQVNASLPSLPTANAGAFASEASLHAPQVAAPVQQAYGTGPAAMSAVLNGAASAGGNVQQVEGQYGTLYYLTTSAMPSKQLEEAARDQFCAEHSVNPAFVRVFDNRRDLESGAAYKVGHVARMVVSNSAPESVRGALPKAIAWVDFDRDGRIKVSPTKDFKETPFAVRQLLSGAPTGQGAF